MSRQSRPPRRFEHPTKGGAYQSDVLSESPLLRMREGIFEYPTAEPIVLYDSSSSLDEEANEEEAVNNDGDDDHSDSTDEEEEEEEEQEEEEDMNDELMDVAQVEDEDTDGLGEDPPAAPEMQEQPQEDNHDDEEEEVEEELLHPDVNPDDVESCDIQYHHEQFFGRSIVRSLLLIVPVLLVVFSAVGIGTTQSPLTEPSDSTGPILKPNLPPCFLSYPVINDADTQNDESMTNVWCDESKEWAPCPTGGTCSHGKLSLCNDLYRFVSDDGYQCLLTSEANATLAQAATILNQWTAQHYCSLRGKGFHLIMDTSPPSFDIYSLVGTLKELHHLLVNSNMFVFDNGHTRIGLDENKAWSVVPLVCRLRIALIQFMEYVEDPVLQAPNIVWFTIKMDPNYTVMFSIVAIALSLVKYRWWRNTNATN